MVGGGAPCCTSPSSAALAKKRASLAVPGLSAGAELVRLQLETTMDTVPPIEACRGRTKEIAPAEATGASVGSARRIAPDAVYMYEVSELESADCELDDADGGSEAHT